MVFDSLARTAAQRSYSFNGYSIIGQLLVTFLSVIRETGGLLFTDRVKVYPSGVGLLWYLI